jgi:cell wall-associated NlpC family hydrolase
MKRIFAVLLSLAFLMVAPAVASADLVSGPTMSRQQAVNYVIARGLAQRGVPFSWGGGNISGPSLGTGPGPAAAPAPDPVGAAGLIPGLPPIPAPLPAAPAPAVVGFDSSGLMQYVFAGVGAKLPRSSGEMYKVGQHVTADQALPGDMIFYGPDGSQSVALFIGNGQMLETAEQGVTVSPVRTAGMAPYLVRVIA